MHQRRPYRARIGDSLYLPDMAAKQDPTEAIREMAAAFPDVAKGTSCNQSSFKAGKGAFLYIGPGAKGVGFKAMFRLEKSIAQAEELAEKQPDRFDVGKNNWVSTWFSAEKPLPKTIWQKWLRESYGLASGGAPAQKKATKKKA